MKCDHCPCASHIDVWSWMSSHPSARLNSFRTRRVCASGREHGAYCQCWRFMVFLMVARAGHPHSAAGTPLFQQCWMAATKSQIHPNSSWEKTQGMPAVILIKHMLPRGKTQPSFMKEGPNPALIPLRCQGPPGLTLMSWCPTGGSPSGPPCPSSTHSLGSIASPRQQVRSQRKVKTWTSQQIKWNATESQL